MKNILILHGALGAQSQFDSLKQELTGEFNILTFNFPGHGGEEIPAESFSIQLFADSVLSFMDRNKLEKVDLFGYSMGGFVAMFLARHFPERVNRVITLATKFYWDETISLKEIKMLDADKIQAKVPAFANELRERHSPEDWKQVLLATSELMTELGKSSALAIDDYKLISSPVLLLLGDKDKMVTLDETVDVFKSLPSAQLGVLPDTLHPIEAVDTKLISFFIRKFLKS